MADQSYTDVGRRADAVCIVGLGCVLPGADSVDAFWQNLPASRWDADAHYSPDRNA